MRREGHHQAVAGGDDGVQVALVVGDQRVVLEDRAGVGTGGLGLRDAAVPQDVVAQVEAADADPLAGGEPRPPGTRPCRCRRRRRRTRPRRRSGAGSRRRRATGSARRGRHAAGSRAPWPRSPGRRRCGAPRRPLPPPGRTSRPSTRSPIELEHPAGSDAAREHLDGRPDQPADDREAVAAGLLPPSSRHGSSAERSSCAPRCRDP